MPFAWVTKRDGRLVPFDADRISRSLFAATESLGRPDAFLARELTDGVLHFLAAEVGGRTPTTADVAEVVVKVVRELGHSPLARAFAEHARQRAAGRTATRERPRDPIADLVEAQRSSADLLADVGRACLREYAVRRVFAPHVIAAQGDGLLTLTGLGAPFEIAGCVLGPVPAGDTPLAAVRAAATVAGGFVAIDSPDHVLARSGASPGEAARYARDLALALDAVRLRGVVNLNCATPPHWVEDLAEGPLFAARRSEPRAEERAGLADVLLEQLLARAVPGLRIDWHLGEADLVADGRLPDLARRALAGAPLTFVLDRPRRPVALAEGLDREHPVALLAIGLHLPRLFEHMLLSPPATGSDGSDAAEGTARLLDKTTTLARLALSAAVQKRDFLRRHGPERPAVTRGFLLDRARLVVVPVGLEATVRSHLGQGLCEPNGGGLECARRIVQRLRTVLQGDGQALALDTCLDGPPPGTRAELGPDHDVGLGACDPAAAAKVQLRAAAALHTGSSGTAHLLAPPERPLSAEEVTELVQYAWRHTPVARLCFRRLAATPRQQLAPWADRDPA